ncbi:Cation transporter family protein [Aphelenchoides besseyi]|nr:Cation transporter family protein [Aphelenchoides besseyi]KAI6216334.1 Cation transporter family protein [Aphelenchoides besseyi]
MFDCWRLSRSLMVVFMFLLWERVFAFGGFDLDTYCQLHGQKLMKPELLISRLMQNYSRSQSPATTPIPVKVEVTVQDISELSVLSNSFTADLWFSAIWQDRRLAFQHLDPCRKNLSFDDTFEKHIWDPNVAFVNTKASRIHESPKKNVLLMLLANGTVWLNYRVRIEAPCDFELSDFPMDKVTCSWSLESYSYNTATVTVDWMSEAVTLITKDFSASDYIFVGLKNYKHTEYYKAGEWYRLTVEIEFKRRYWFYLLQIYVPSYIYVLISFITFVIELKALPARVILTVNTLMSLCLQFGNVISSLPPVSYVKSVDYFMFTCIAFIFASTVELAFIAYQEKKMILRRLKFDWSWDALRIFGCVYSDRDPYETQSYYGAPEEVSVEEVMELQRHFRRKPSARRRRSRNRAEFLDRGSRIDKISFILFPSAFLLFNIVYWGLNLTKF